MNTEVRTTLPEMHSERSGRRVVLVRHGETAENRDGRFLGRSDPSLNELGLAQSRALRTVVHEFSPTTLVSSPARRAVETTGQLTDADPLVDDAFREIDFGRWEGHTQQEIESFHPEELAAFRHGRIEGFPGGETVEAVRDRVLDALGRHDCDRLVVITHATVIRIAVAALLGLPVTEYRLSMGRPSNGAWTELERHTGGWRLHRYDWQPPQSPKHYDEARGDRGK